MFLIAWLAVLVAAASALWLLAAFVLRAGRGTRLILSAFVPAGAVVCLFFAQYWTGRTPPAEPGWDIFYAVACFISGVATLIVTVPVFHIAERRFGQTDPKA
jgi:hypothetical protein